MKLTLDSILLLGMLLCFLLGHLFGADRFVLLAGLMLLVFVLRLIGSSASWILRGR